jgi:hypothetical protein
MIENLVLMLTGSTMAFFGCLFYRSVGTAFLSRGRFRNKFEALIIFALSIIVTSWLTVIVQSFWEYITNFFSFWGLVGMVLIAGMVGVNRTVENWKYLDIKSIFIYIIGFIMILFV